MSASRAVLYCVVGAAIGVGCLFPDLASLNGTTSDGATPDVGSDASHTNVVIVSAGSVMAATGNAQQTHVVWAAGAQRWWLFYIDDDTMVLKTRSSADFTTWQDGASLTLPFTNAGEGRNFSVYYASLGGVDVVHVSFSHLVSASGPLFHSHARATISGSTITFGSAGVVCASDGGTLGADSPVTTVDPTGTVWDATGFVHSIGHDGDYNEDVFQSSEPDDGQGWTGSFTQTTVEIVPDSVNARAFLYAGGLSAVWTSGDQEPDPTNLHFSEYSGTWATPSSIFDDEEQDQNDWDVAALTTPDGVEGHVVRALLAGGYEHAYGAGGNGMNAVAPATQARIVGGGLVVLADPSHLAAFDLVPGGVVMTSRWSETGGDAGTGSWSAWTNAATTHAGAFLSGYCPDLDTHPEAGGCALVWTEPVDGGFEIAGQLVNVR